MKYLEAKEYYMNPETGSVDTGENWEKDFEGATDEDGNAVTWEQWGGDTLICVAAIEIIRI
jgi:hypothetical protein